MKDNIQQTNTEELSKKDRVKAYHKKYRESKKEECIARVKAWREANKERCVAYYQANKERIAAQAKAYREANLGKLIAKRREYDAANRAHINAQQIKRRKEDVIYKLQCTLRCHSSRAFKRIGQSKPTKTEHLLGCSWEEAKTHIESLFTEGMSWNNYGSWHIDHIVPIASATTLEEAQALNHISNLQPLWAKDNLTKGAKGKTI